MKNEKEDTIVKVINYTVIPMLLLILYLLFVAIFYLIAKLFIENNDMIVALIGATSGVLSVGVTYLIYKANMKYYYDRDEKERRLSIIPFIYITNDLLGHINQNSISIYNSEWPEDESLENVITHHCFIAFENVGVGSAVNVRFYSKRMTVATGWNSINLKVGDKINFVLKISTEREIERINDVQIQYNDIFGNVYVQELMFLSSNEGKINKCSIIPTKKPRRIITSEAP
ncbi:hypothetical protein [Paenibacillus endoradicis]|uniref:hypothetical protein n=1 Tax=Paenibacillus endoradicis TaxID=2972487 RepID=UPI002159B035|nr:hypothetical protein [Paenibacillus endoradicis]MCR8656950.1 hypothetical protein [Paenibacillus endoradicis]